MSSATISNLAQEYEAAIRASGKRVTKAAREWGAAAEEAIRQLGIASVAHVREPRAAMGSAASDPEAWRALRDMEARGVLDLFIRLCMVVSLRAVAPQRMACRVVSRGRRAHVRGQDREAGRRACRLARRAWRARAHASRRRVTRQSSWVDPPRPRPAGREGGRQ